MAGLKFSEVVSCLERTDPAQPPAFYYALEVVKRYSRAKIAKGSGRHLICKHGRLETLEAKFSSLGFQDIFYLTRLQLKLPPSSINLPPPSCVVRQTLLKAGYPLPAKCQNTCEIPSAPSSSSTSYPTHRTSHTVSPRKIRMEGRRGSRSLTSSPNPSQALLPINNTLRRSSSSIPDLSSLKTLEKININKSTSIPKSTSSPTSPKSPRHSGNYSPDQGSSRWTPLLSGLGFKSVFDHSQSSNNPQEQKTIHQHIESESNLPSPLIKPYKSEVHFTYNPFQSQPQETVPPIIRDVQDQTLNPQSPHSLETPNLTPLHLNRSAEAEEEEEELVPLELILSESRFDKYGNTYSVEQEGKKYVDQIKYVENDLDWTLPLQTI